ncbi:MAG: endonuclease III [Bacteroidales bacterium]|nr:endonuclease III [Bacteroidales bacterium]
MTQKERYLKFVTYFSGHLPNAQTELEFGTPFQLLVATLLSAQCTDKRVNMVTPNLFAAYPTAEAMAQASEKELLNYVRSVSYPNSKSRHLLAMSKKLVADYGGEVPRDVVALQTLPGVGRKTANVVASVAFGQSRMPVDTHVYRVANRIGLTNNSKTPLQTEETLVRHLPADVVPKAHHWLILHGRYVCQARKPKCDVCGITDICKYFLKECEVGVRPATPVKTTPQS